MEIAIKNTKFTKRKLLGQKNCEQFTTRLETKTKTGTKL